MGEQQPKFRSLVFHQLKGPGRLGEASSNLKCCRNEYGVFNKVIEKMIEIHQNRLLKITVDFLFIFYALADDFFSSVDFFILARCSSLVGLTVGLVTASKRALLTSSPARYFAAVKL